jgi:N-methylhydantoinase B
MSAIDPVTLEVLNTQFAAATEEMGETLKRCARSLYVKESTDYGVGLVALDGRLFAVPRGYGSAQIGLDCATVLRDVGPLEEGDVVLTNHPYLSGGLVSHTPDLTLIRPYFHDGELVCYGYDFIHSTDVGGKVPSSISPTSTELFQEGLLIPPMKLVRRGEPNADVIALFRANVRTPDLNLHDLEAMRAALETGARRLSLMIAEHGIATIRAAPRALMDYGARKARAVLRRIPDGEATFWDYLDDDAIGPLPVRFRVTVRATDGRIHLDFTGTDPQVVSAYNLPTLGLRHPWLTARLLHYVITHDPSAPLNAGLLEPITVEVPVGTVLNPAFPAATGVRHASGYRLNDAVVGALAMLVPHDVPTPSGGAMVPVVLAEHDRETGARNVLVLNAVIVGSGARCGSDGYDGIDGSISSIRNTPAEKTELEAGVDVLAYGLRPDSAGPGRWRGGLGLRFVFRVTQAGSTVLGRGLERLFFRPWGAFGGRPGARTRVILNPGTPAERDLGKIDALRVEAGDVVCFLTPGGGGWGDPFLRDPEAVATDVRAGFVSLASAAADYGVAIADGRVDPAATAALRAARPIVDDGAFRFDGGPERAWWDAAFPDADAAALAGRLAAAPANLRTAGREAAFDTALGGTAAAMADLRAGRFPDAAAVAARFRTAVGNP